jgi:hypothetical protein
VMSGGSIRSCSPISGSARESLDVEQGLLLRNRPETALSESAGTGSGERAAVGCEEEQKCAV